MPVSVSLVRIETGQLLQLLITRPRRKDDLEFLGSRTEDC